MIPFLKTEINGVAVVGQARIVPPVGKGAAVTRYQLENGEVVTEQDDGTPAAWPGDAPEGGAA